VERRPVKESITVRAAVLIPALALALFGAFFVLHPEVSASLPQPEARTFEVEVREVGMSPPEVAVSRGDRITLRITSDRLAELHVHGYDLTAGVGPGEVVELEFEADITGRFTIEVHPAGDHSHEEAGKLVVRPR
jgi:heme/copper-type cytochrome/quinol oxidase subunit 2